MMRTTCQVALLSFCMSCVMEDKDTDSGDDWGFYGNGSSSEPFGDSGGGGGNGDGGGTSGGGEATGGGSTGGGSTDGGSTGGGTTDGGSGTYACGDADGDGCDDCTIEGSPNPTNDGWDYDGDGQCEIALDPACLHGEMAATDPEREKACILFALANMDRALFTDETDGAPPLEWNEDVWKVANGHARDMCARDYYEHTTPEGLSPSDRAEAMGFDFGLAENIHLSINPFNAHFDFMAEPTCVGHRANILYPIATEAGIAVHTCNNPAASTTDGWMVVTENFIWDWSLPDPAYCAVDANICEVPEYPISLAREWCNTFDCDEVADWTFDAYCPSGSDGDVPPRIAPFVPEKIQ